MRQVGRQQVLAAAAAAALPALLTALPPPHLPVTDAPCRPTCHYRLRCCGRSCPPAPNRYMLPLPPIDCSCGTFERMFLSLLREEGRGEDWRLFYAFKGELPSAEELRSFRGVVITGSVADAFGEEEWLVALRCTVREAMDQQKQVLVSLLFLGYQ